jgi:hypothetical protein
MQARMAAPIPPFFAAGKRHPDGFRVIFRARFLDTKIPFGGEKRRPKERQFFCSTKFHRLVTISLARP